MNYAVNKTFTKIAESSGTLQNASKFLFVEVSNTTVEGSGFLVPPLRSITFDTEPLYVRCANGSGAEVRCVPFKVKGGSSGGGSGSGDAPSSLVVATDEEMAEMLNNNFGTEE